MRAPDLAGWPRGIRLSLALLALASTAPAGALHATHLPQDDEAAAVAAAALPALRALLPSGRAGLDPGPTCRARLARWNCPDPLARAAESLGMALSSQLFTRVCVGDERCRLLGVQSLVRLEAPAVQDETATVDAVVWKRGASRAASVTRQRYRVRLVRRGGAWNVADVDPLG